MKKRFFGLLLVLMLCMISLSLFSGCVSEYKLEDDWYMKPLEPIEPYYPKKWFNEDWNGEWNYGS